MNPLQKYMNNALAYDDPTDGNGASMDEVLNARHAEVKNWQDLVMQRGTPIPTLFNTYYKFIQNPSAVSVETFKRMVDTDDTVGAGCDFLATCLAARLGRYTHPSKEISAWMNKVLDQMEGGFTNFIKELLSATWAGFYIGEKCWANTVDGFIIERVAALPPTTILFEVDRIGRLTADGVLQYQRNWNPMGLSGGLGYYGGTVGSGFSVGGQPDPFARFGDLPFPLRTSNSYNYLSIRIPTQKVVHYAFDAQGKFGNPYGRSLLRRCYKYYVAKDAYLKMLATALDRKGTPLMVVYADQHATVGDERKYTAAGKTNRGKANGERADLAAQRVFKNVHNDSVMILPGKKGTIYDVEAISQQSNASDFLAAIDMCNRGELRALLIPTLIFGNGDGQGSFALGQEHARTFDKICDGMNAGMMHCLLNQVVKDLLMYNFPRSAWEKDGLGSFGQRELTTEERQKEMEVIEKAVNLGLSDPADDLEELNNLRERIGMEPKEELIERPDPMGMGGGEGDDGFGSSVPGEAGDKPGADKGNRKPGGGKPEKGASDGTKEG